MMLGPVEVFYGADLRVEEWARRHEQGAVPDRWPYGLDAIAPGVVSRPRNAEDWDLRARALRKLDRRYDWAARAPRDAGAVCWDERTGVPVAATRGDHPVLTGVIWLTDVPGPHGLRDHVTQRALRRCDAVWVLSSAQLDPLHRNWKVPEDRLHHVLFGVDERFWTPGDTADRPDTETVLVVGNDRDRDHPSVVRAVQQARAVRPALRLVLASTQPVPVPPELGQRIESVPHAELVQRYRSAAVVALGMRDNLHCSGVTAVLEAMACARPVVVSATPGMHDYVQDGETGLLVPPGDEQAMTDAVLGLLADPDAAEALGRRARAAVERRFTSTAMSARLAALVAGAGA